MMMTDIITSEDILSYLVTTTNSGLQIYPNDSWRFQRTHFIKMSTLLMASEGQLETARRRIILEFERPQKFR